MNAQSTFSRRKFLTAAALAVAGSALAHGESEAAPELIIDIHQHLGYGGKRDKQGNQLGPGRTDEQLIQHQHNMGVTQTIVLPSGRPCVRPSTHQGFSNGLEATCDGNERCLAFARAHPGEFFSAANEVPDLEDAPATIEKYLRQGAVAIAEQKFGVECDSPQMQELYQLATDCKVPILMHWQYGFYNYGYERFDKMLVKYPDTIFVGHAQTFWANIDKNNQDNPKKLYPTGKVTPGGRTDRYLTDYPNFYGDLSAGSGNNALTRDPEHARAFLERHQNQLVFGSDCVDRIGHGPACSGWSTLKTVRELIPDKTVRHKLFYANAKRIYHL